MASGCAPIALANHTLGLARHALPHNPQSLNPYTYARNNPTTLTDPTGLCWVCDTVGSAVGAVGSAVGGTVKFVKDIPGKTVGGFRASYDCLTIGCRAPTARARPTSSLAAAISQWLKGPATQIVGETIIEAAIGATAGGGLIQGIGACSTGDTLTCALSVPGPAADIIETGTDIARAARTVRPANVTDDAADIVRPTTRPARQAARATPGVADEALPAALRGGPANVDVYLGISNGKPVYAGITNNLGRRAGLLEAVTLSPVTRGQARAIEEALFMRNPGFQNIRHPISPSHSWYEDALDWGHAWLHNNGF